MSTDLVKKLRDILSDYTTYDSDKVEQCRALLTASPLTDHAENLAKALECYLSAHDILSGVQSADDATGQNDASEGGFHDKANDAWRAMRTALHEYCKRRAVKTEAPRPDLDFTSETGFPEEVP